MQAFFTCPKVLKATIKRNESFRTSLNILKCILNILKQVSKGEKISFRVRGREGVEGTYVALPLHSMKGHVGLKNHNNTACLLHTFVRCVRDICLLSEGNFFVLRLTISFSKQKISGGQIQYPHWTPSNGGQDFNFRAIEPQGNKMQIF